jgi:hypothetical protein
VTFTPTGPGTVQGTLSVTDSVIGSPQTVALTGTGTVVALSPISVNFGDQRVGTKSKPVPTKLTNTWTMALSISISQIKITGPDTENFNQTNNCGNGEPAGATVRSWSTLLPRRRVNALRNSVSSTMEVVAHKRCT